MRSSSQSHNTPIYTKQHRQINASVVAKLLGRKGPILVHGQGLTSPMSGMPNVITLSMSRTMDQKRNRHFLSLKSMPANTNLLDMIESDPEFLQHSVSTEPQLPGEKEAMKKL